MAEKEPARKPTAKTKGFVVASVRPDPNGYAPAANARTMYT